MKDRLDSLVSHLASRRDDIAPDGCRLIRNSGPAVADLEAQLSLRLPPPYRDFLTRYGGVQLDNVLVGASGGVDEYSETVGLMSFFGLYDPPTSDADCTYDIRYVTESEQLPPGIVPFAEFGSDLFCIRCDGPTSGTVYLKRQKQFDDDDPGKLLSVHSLGFLEFLQSLRTMTDVEADEWYRAKGG
jgi:hypothetical protein